MQPVSPFYKNDKDSGLSADIQSYLDHHYFSQLKNLNRTNPKLLVVFSGGNAVGKTTISRLIEEQLGGLVLENDEIKRCLLELKPDIPKDELNRATWQYGMHIYKHLDERVKNGLIVRDGVIDWYYDRILPVFEKQGYPLFIIGFDLSQEKVIELIRKRGDTPTVKEERFYLLLKDHIYYSKRFRNEYTPDIMLNDDTVFNHQLIIDALHERLEQIEN